MRLALLAASLAVASFAAHAQQSPDDLDVRAHVKMLVDADGVPGDIKVTGATPEIGALVYKRAKDWKFKPAQWQGKAVAAPFAGWLKLDVQSNSAGGFSVRMGGFEGASGSDSMETPSRSEEMGGANFLSHVVFGYVVNTRADGSVESFEAVLPKRPPAAQAQKVARNIETMLKLWRGEPQVAAGGRVACSRLYLEEHKPNLMGRGAPVGYRGWAGTADLDRFPAEVATAIQEELSKLDDQGTHCPAPVLQTKVAGVAL